jgi:hypothetical protein
MTVLKSLLVLCTLAGMVNAGTLKNGLLTVDGKPFYVLSSWNDRSTTLEDVARLGMNAAFRGASSTDSAIAIFRTYMRAAAERDIQVIPYVSYGGGGIVPWAPDAVRRLAKLASEPNLLAWYVGDDISMKHLPGIRQTVSILRKESPKLATVADYIARETPEAKSVFTEYVDIRCQYYYPIPENSLYSFTKFFDDQRAFVGDPLWTWIQCFVWRKQATQYGWGRRDGVGPVPEPEQVRLMSYVSINRGVRGLMFFPQKMLVMQPELAAEVAYICHEIRLFNDHLAGGAFTLDLACSDTSVKATAYTYGKSVAVSAALIKDTYHRWVDDATVKNVTISVPWNQTMLPKAAILRLPDVIDCTVSKGKTAGTVDVTVPELEVAGLMLVSNDEAEFSQLREGAKDASAKLSQLAVTGSVAQARKVGTTLWQIGVPHLYRDLNDYLPAVKAAEAAAYAHDAGRHEDAVRSWRTSLRILRQNLDGAMQLAFERKHLLTQEDIRNLHTPYSLYKINELMTPLTVGKEWHFVQNFGVVGPFPLNAHNESEAKPDLFDHPYGPEKTTNMSGTFKSVDGHTGWASARTSLTGRLDLLKSFRTTQDVLCYIRCAVTSPVDSTFTLGLGSNDGVILWVNGKQTFYRFRGRSATPNDDIMKIRLRKGKNRIMAKVVNIGHNWAYYLSFDDPKRILTYSVD